MNAAAARTTDPIYSEIDNVAHDICCAARFALIVGGGVHLLSPVDGSGSAEMSKHLLRDLAVVLGGIPHGEVLRISFQGATAHTANAVIAALDASGFKLEAVARHDDEMLGRPGKEKPARYGMLAFRAPKDIAAEIGAFISNVVQLVGAPTIPPM
jgi:hypothetical protein